MMLNDCCIKERQFMRSHCPLGKMSCIGRYRRNVLTLNQTMAWVVLWCLSGILDICLQVLFIYYKEQWSSETLFWIWNTKGFVANEGLLILIPFALSVPSEGSSETSSSTGFYVHKPSVLEPRRPLIKQAASWNPPKLIYVQEYAGEPSPLNKKEKKDNWELNKGICPKESNRDNPLPKKEIPLMEPQREEIVMSVPNLRHKNEFPSILYCKVHNAYRIVK